MPTVKIGSREHRDLMCSEFERTFNNYRVNEIEWPELTSDELARLRGMPFWNEALQTERIATRRIKLMVEAERDPVVRDSVAMQAFEEGRHASLFTGLMEHYGIPVPDPDSYTPRDPEWGFMRMGYGEVFDIFFAFGLFKLGSDAGFFPESLAQIFESLIAEEARHILFFSNWATYGGANATLLAKPWFSIRRASALAVQAFGRARTAYQMARGGDVEKADDFVIQAPGQIVGEDLTLRKFIETCVSENDRRMSQFDPRLPRPTLLPKMMRMVLRAMPKPAAA
ncbi:MAG TPA: ferritin-like domain-containing protein [Candidatus Binataceae bacterium]|nr:ferritin-like domain-containing protein [Candidatus Binataceae bacterium]